MCLYAKFDFAMIRGSDNAGSQNWMPMHSICHHRLAGRGVTCCSRHACGKVLHLDTAWLPRQCFQAELERTMLAMDDTAVTPGMTMGAHAHVLQPLVQYQYIDIAIGICGLHTTRNTCLCTIILSLGILNMTKSAAVTTVVLHTSTTKHGTTGWRNKAYAHISAVHVLCAHVLLLKTDVRIARSWHST